MTAMLELAELSRLLKMVAITTRQIAREERAKAPEIHWAAHCIDEVADDLRSLSGAAYDVLPHRKSQRLI